MIFLTAIVFIVIFSLLILAHELGHFWMAKRAGVKIEEFGFGLPPRIFGIKKGETLYSINWIPFGGFVRMLGEDAVDADALKSKRSFVNQSFMNQTKIVCGGVFMNFLLAFVLLTVGFLIGIQPLIADSDSFYAAIEDGQIELEPGFVVSAADDSLNVGDRIVKVNGANLNSIEEWQAILNSGGTMDLLISRENNLFSVKVDQVETAPTYLNRMIYLADEDSVFDKKLKSGDAIMSVEGAQIFDSADLSAAILGKTSVDVTYYRPGTGVLESNVLLPAVYPVISYIENASPAEEAGLAIGDKVKMIDGKRILSANDVVEATKAVGGDSIRYIVMRGGAEMSFDIPLRAEDRRVGVAVANLMIQPTELSFYEGLVPETIMKIKDVRYGLRAPVQALSDMWRLGKLTAVMFVKVLGNFVSGGDVPAGVSGPVGIAQMTYVFLQDGFAAIIRFTALLSLSLGVINILPIPALDGGRFLFILVQGITGKKANPRIESWIHGAGFIFLLLFIVYVTFNDVLRLF